MPQRARAPHIEHVAEVDAHGAHVHHHLPRAGGDVGADGHKRLERAARLGDQLEAAARTRGRRRQQPRREAHAGCVARAKRVAGGSAVGRWHRKRERGAGAGRRARVGGKRGQARRGQLARGGAQHAARRRGSRRCVGARRQPQRACGRRAAAAAARQ